MALRAGLAVAVLLLSSVATVSGGSDGSLTFTLELGETRCFFEEARDRNTRMFVHTMAIDGGHDLTLFISGPHDKKTYAVDSEPDQNFKDPVVFEASLHHHKGEQRVLFDTKEADSLYRVCVRNGAVMMKSVLLSIKSHDPTRRGIGPLKPLEPIQQTVIRLSESLHNIKEDQIMMRSRERIHAETADMLHQRVVFWSGCASLMLIAMGVGQLWYYHQILGSSSVRSRGV